VEGRLASLARFGVDLTITLCNKARSTSMTVSALDFKLGIRMLRRYPTITVMATAAMAVAIALGMLYFEGLNKVLHPVLPIAGGDRIVTIRNFDSAKFDAEPRSLHDFAVWRTQVRTIEQLGAAW